MSANSRTFSKLLRTAAYSNRFTDLQADPYNMLWTFVHFLGFVIVFSSFVYMGVLRRIVISEVDIDSVD